MTDKPSFFTELQNKINEVLQQSPARDLEKNMKAMLSQGFSKLDLLTREEFDVVRDMAQKAREENAALKAELEKLKR